MKPQQAGNSQSNFEQENHHTSGFKNMLKATVIKWYDIIIKNRHKDQLNRLELRNKSTHL